MRKFIIAVLAFGIVGFGYRAEAAPVATSQILLLKRNIKIGWIMISCSGGSLTLMRQMWAEVNSCELSYTIAEGDVYACSAC